MHFAVALEADGGVGLRGGVIAARQQLEAARRVYFFTVFLRKISISARLPTRDTQGRTARPPLSRAYIRRSRTIFPAERRRSRRRPSSVAVRNDDNLAPVCKRGANAFFRSLALAV